jgi:hypothetical protein
MSANFEIASLEGLGAHVFKGSVAATYLAKQGLPANTLDNGDWAKDSRADKVIIDSKRFFFFIHSLLISTLL